MHIFLIIFGSVLILAVWGAACYFFGRGFGQLASESDLIDLQRQRDAAKKRADEFEELAADYSDEYARMEECAKQLTRKLNELEDLHRHCAAANPVPDLDEPSHQLAFYEEFTGMYPIVGAALEGDDFTGGWDHRLLRESIEAQSEQMALPSGGAA